MVLATIVVQADSPDGNVCNNTNYTMQYLCNDCLGIAFLLFNRICF